MSETPEQALQRMTDRASKLESLLHALQHGVKTHEGVRIRRDDKDSTPARKGRCLGTDTSVSGDV